ncbi:hypothetical protein [Moorena bouillonii]|uniref:hypothetical protein n=1 Tax=Moorena bouillonii TaxID=207920 RepID=UPI0018E997EA|nr:hypothetical protein [Moorena bouillonii]
MTNKYIDKQVTTVWRDPGSTKLMVIEGVSTELVELIFLSNSHDELGLLNHLHRGIGRH